MYFVKNQLVWVWTKGGSYTCDWSYTCILPNKYTYTICCVHNLPTMQPWTKFPEIPCKNLIMGLQKCIVIWNTLLYLSRRYSVGARLAAGKTAHVWRTSYPVPSSASVLPVKTLIQHQWHWEQHLGGDVRVLCCTLWRHRKLFLSHWRGWWTNEGIQFHCEQPKTSPGKELFKMGLQMV